ncbi:DUF3810 domain-containing protein [Ruminococcus sp.]|uniref:DUF3810 domain-containing protein n=1 Tax=Ruminococcus sp. TaxID=41978 RepID=UPI0026396631|nr:DUF3810 domain-containing protein [Ruminococcus sp.]MDD7556217.1 DUF3810 domain-containing protein [Ruminococcus sp.]MDY4963699.1 DUF3810 domain-containing protein [Ruminococcus callidus]
MTHRCSGMPRLWKGLLIWAVVLAAVNGIAWISPALCDAYRLYVFHYISRVPMALTSPVSIPLGEVLAIIGAVLLFLVLPLSLLAGLCYKPWRRRLGWFWRRFIAWAVLIVMTLQTLNCFPLYHCTKLSEVYGASETATAEELLDTYEKVVRQMAQQIGELPRDPETGRPVLPADMDLNAEAAAAMGRLSDSHPELAGAYPVPKRFLCVKLFRYGGTIGLYYPYTMETTCSPLLTDSHLPVTLCHELAHTKGFLPEDEANFLAYLACIGSADSMFRYSGYLFALEYLWDEVWKLDPDVYEERINQIETMVPGDMWWDLYEYYPPEIREADEQADEAEQKLSEAVEQMNDTLTDASMKLNGVEDGIHSYDRVVQLMIAYYRDKDGDS